MNDHPPINARLHQRDQIRAALDLLEKSAKDIEEREDNTFARGIPGRAVGHIREAVRFTREAVEDRSARAGAASAAVPLFDPQFALASTATSRFRVTATARLR